MLALLFSRLIPKNTKKGTFLSDIVKKIKLIFKTEIFYVKNLVSEDFTQRQQRFRKEILATYVFSLCVVA